MMITISLVLCLVAPALTIEGGATSYDYSYMERQDYTMGNEYVNITNFSSVAFVDINVSTSNDNHRISFSNINFEAYGRFLRVNNTFFKYIIDNSNQMVCYQTEDLLYYEEKPIYYNDSLIDITGADTLGMTPFYWNNSYYVFYHNASTNNLECLNGTNTTHFNNKTTVIGSYFGSREIVPLSIYFINETFYMFATNYSSTTNDYIELFSSDNLTNNWTVVSTFKNEFSINGNDRIYSARLYEYNNSYYFFKEIWDNVASEINTTLYILNKTDLLNFSQYTPVHQSNNARWYFTEYIPVGGTLVQWSYDRLFLDYYIIRYKPLIPLLFYDNTVIHKIYPQLMIETNTTNVNKSVVFTDYISMNPLKITFPYTVETSNGLKTYHRYWSVTSALYYIQTVKLEINKTIYSKTIINYKVFFPFISSTAQQVKLFINHTEYGFYNENWVEYAGTLNDYAQFNEFAINTPNGTKSSKQAVIQMSIIDVGGVKMDTSYYVSVYQNPSEYENPWLLLLEGDNWRVVLGLSVFTIGIFIVLLGAIAKKETVVTWGLILTVSGLGLIGGSGLFSVLF